MRAVGPKEQGLRDLRALRPHHKLMIEDGLPECCVRIPGEKPISTVPNQEPGIRAPAKKLEKLHDDAEVRREADLRWRSWTPSRERPSRPRRSMFEKEVRKEQASIDAKAAAPAAAELEEESAMRKTKTKKASRSTRRRVLVQRSSKTKKGGIPAVDVGALICRQKGHRDAPEGGASMAELEAAFKIDAHPMRAKIHYLRHEMGYVIDRRGGRYHGLPPTKKAAQ